ncbi:MAG: membrane protein insertion efficiency factor YidD [Oscillospiraceae bacterium]|nr:membrane protein insertion efficiency factor YidD [Oscillospiraceae bacterium]
MKKLLLLIIGAYRKLISPLIPPRCKYYPTCSTYAVQAIEKHGAIKGTILAAWRLLRCNPWSLGGVDPVPDKFSFYRLKKH